MSCYVVVTLPEHLVLVADNRRRVFGRMGQAPFERPIVVDDAKKLLRVSERFWITGVGLSDFGATIVSAMKSKAEQLTSNRQFILGDFLQSIPSSDQLRQTYDEILAETLAVRDAIGGSPVDPREIVTDVVFAALAGDNTPFVARASSRRRFAVESFCGPGHILLSPLGFPEASPFETAIRDWIEANTNQMLEAGQEEIVERSLDLFPPAMELISKKLPARVSPTGDLLVIGPQRARWLLF